MEKQPNRVLVVDDSEGQRRMLGAVVTSAGSQVAFAIDGKEAVAAASRSHFDLIFMDVSMPVMDGFTATATIRADEKALHRKRTPIYIVTSHDDDEHRQAARRAGADGHIGKPTATSRLVEVIALHAP